ncbi:MAG TPA: hypothetical protein VEV17_06665 [Bryobacteraceae bacterium]|nr:hypothetical protein [Bryobacteraceae bacterium]
MSLQLFKSLLCAFLLAGTVSAQITIKSVVNAASRQPTNLAQGVLFAVTGPGVGVDAQTATFPLPTTGGLGGVTVQAAVSGAVVDCIMVYVKPNEVGAILPSGTPLGAGTITVNNNGLTASKDINVVDAEFGIFTTNYPVALGPALAFNVNADGSNTLNTTTQSVMPGQDVLINGTGLGAVSSDETQSGVTDVPSTPFKIYVGFQPATLVSAGRGTCCDGIDPNYQVPPGIAAWDVIRFTVPDGVAGCYMPVAVQIGKTVSNLAVISVDPSGAACQPTASILPPELTDTLANQTGVSLGHVGIGRSIAMRVNNKGVLATTKQDGGSATFIRYPDLPASAITPETIYPENVCSIGGWPGANGPGSADVNGNPVTIVPLKSIALDAGTPIVVQGPSGSRNIVKRTVGNLFDYPSVTFGNTTPGNFFDPGHYTVTDAGGKDVGNFSGAIDVPSEHFIWTNIPDITQPLDRTQDLLIQWTGGAPGTQVIVAGSGLANGVDTAFLCAAAVEAGQMTIPSYVLLQIPPTSESPLAGGLTVENPSWSLFNAPGLDYGTFSYDDSYHLSVNYQ